MIELLITKEELQRYSSVADAELNELLKDVRELNPNIYVKEYSYRKKSLFKKCQIMTLYALMIDGQGGVQLFNFPPKDELGSINTHVTKQVLFTYLFGYYNGYYQSNKEKKK